MNSIKQFINSSRVLVLGLLLLVGIIGMIVMIRNKNEGLIQGQGIGWGVVELPYDNTNPIIFDNDEVIDSYTDEYVMALASAGDINLVGIITSSSVSPFNPWVSPKDYERFVDQRAEEARLARNSGFSNIPDPVRGTKGHLQKPSSGKISDTKPIGSKGSWLVVNEAKKSTPEKPLVLVMCGPLTVAADAYLLDNSVANKVIVVWLGGNEDDMGNNNGYEDPWAAYIVLQKLRLVIFPPNWTVGKGDPHVPKSKLTELPDTELRQWMIDKQHPTNPLPDERDIDAPPAISLMRPDYVFKVKIYRRPGNRFSFVKAKKVSFSHWITESNYEIPAFKEDPNGNALVLPTVRRDVATEEWWRAMKNPAAYNGGNKRVDEREEFNSVLD